MYYCTGASITDESLDRAAFLRFNDRKSWDAICKEIGTSRPTLQAARETDRWEKIAKRYDLRRMDLRRLAYIQLEELVLQGGLPAIIQALDRTEGTIEQTLKAEIEQYGDNRGLTIEQLAEVVDILRECSALKQAGLEPAGLEAE